MLAHRGEQVKAGNQSQYIDNMGAQSEVLLFTCHVKTESMEFWTASWA